MYDLIISTSASETVHTYRSLPAARKAMNEAVESYIAKGFDMVYFDYSQSWQGQGDYEVLIYIR